MGFPVEFCNGTDAGENYRVMALPGDGKSLTICSFIKTQYQHRTDKGTELVKQYCAQHAMHTDAR